MSGSIITLLTDFGVSGGYVGSSKGVILKINPDAKILDISHSIAPFDVWEGAFVLNGFYQYFPQGTIHLAIVDPGVGGKRPALLIKTENYFFLGPDNGIFSFIYEKEKVEEIITIKNEKYLLPSPCSTFQGRDIFAPIAAYLSLGVKLEEFGEKTESCFKFKIPEPRIEKKKITGEIIHIDRFGNLVSSIDIAMVEALKRKRGFKIKYKRKVLTQISQYYAEAKSKEIIALVGSVGFLEIAVNQGNAKQILKGAIGDQVEIEFEN